MEPEISPEEAAALAERGDGHLVDVRRPDEWEEGRIAGATHIPLDELQARSSEVPDGPVVFYCRTGDRSEMAAAAFRSAGRDATSLSGGLDAWEASGRSVES
jgi:rhodanese-related sulfurtransferase